MISVTRHRPFEADHPVQVCRSESRNEPQSSKWVRGGPRGRHAAGGRGSGPSLGMGLPFPSPPPESEAFPKEAEVGAGAECGNCFSPFIGHLLCAVSETSALVMLTAAWVWTDEPPVGWQTRRHLEAKGLAGATGLHSHLDRGPRKQRLSPCPSGAW